MKIKSKRLLFLIVFIFINFGFITSIFIKNPKISFSNFYKETSIVFSLILIFGMLLISIDQYKKDKNNEN